MSVKKPPSQSSDAQKQPKPGDYETRSTGGMTHKQHRNVDRRGSTAEASQQVVGSENSGR